MIFHFGCYSLPQLPNDPNLRGYFSLLVHEGTEDIPHARQTDTFATTLRFSCNKLNEVNMYRQSLQRISFVSKPTPIVSTE